jgi:hypothetical protein
MRGEQGGGGQVVRAGLAADQAAAVAEAAPAFGSTRARRFLLRSWLVQHTR